MKTVRPTGLGEPGLPGKLNLFKPPEGERALNKAGLPNPQPALALEKSAQKRIRTTVFLTWEAFQVIEGVQTQYRMKTGKVLPLWKAASQLIERGGKSGEMKKTGRTVL